MSAARHLIRVRVAALVTTATLVGALAISDAPALRADEAGSGTGETIVGELVQVWSEPEHAEDAAESEDTEPLSWIATSDGDAVRVPTEDLDRLTDASPGATVSVTVGDEAVEEAVTAGGFEPAREVLDAEVVLPAPAEAEQAPVEAVAGLTHRVTVVLVRPGGAAADGRTVQQVVDAVNGPVADFWAGQSDGSIRIGVSASHDWRTTTATCSTPVQLWDEVAGQVGWSRAPGEHLMLYVPGSQTNCSYGIAEVGGGLSGGGRLYVRDLATSLVAHEIGHNFSLGHSSEMQCSERVDTGSCRVTSYNDWYDVMGFSWDEVGSLNAPQTSLLGLLPSDERVTASTWSPADSYLLSPTSAASGIRAIELTSPSGVRYWLEYRQASGQDAWLATEANWPGLDEGVTVRRSSAGADTSLLFDGTPSITTDFGSDRRVALPPGRSVHFVGGDFTVTVDSVTPAGATVSIRPGPTPVGVKYAAVGGPETLGPPTGTEFCGLPHGGCFRAYQHGSIYWSPATGARMVAAGAVRNRWAGLRWERGSLGYPMTDTTCGLRGGGCFQHFQGGSVYHSVASGTAIVRGTVRARWAASGWETGALGYPVTDERCGLVRGGCFQHFQGGSIYWSPDTGARLVTGAQRSRWSALGWERSFLGYPTTDTVCGLVDGGCFQHFQGGSVYWTAATGARTVRGPQRARWAALGWEGGVLGYPVTDTICGLPGGGCFQHFQRGSLYSSADTGTALVRNQIRARWAASGWERGSLGYPVTDERCGLIGGGCFQHYQRGSIYWSPATGARLVANPIRRTWAAGGWETGSLGYPVEDARAVPGGHAQRFQGGTLTYSASTRQVRRS